MCYGDELPSAFANAVFQILAIAGIELALVIVDKTPPVRSTGKEKLLKLLKLNGALWALYQKLFPFEKIPAYRPVDMQGIFAGVPRIECTVMRKGKFSEYFTARDIEAVGSHKLDFVLRFGFGIIRGEILKIPKYGVWSFHHGDELKFRGGPPGFWEIYLGEPVTASIFQRLTDRLDGGVVLQKCFSKTDQHSYSGNLNKILDATSYMPARVCRDILNGCAEYVEAPPSSTRAPIRRAPNDPQMALFMVRTGFRFLRDQIKALLFSESWNVGITRTPVEQLLEGVNPQAVEWLPISQPNGFLADPFVVAGGENGAGDNKAGEKHRLMMEAFDDFSNRGNIVEAEIDQSGRLSSSVHTAIDNGQHMSYPFLVKHEGQLYCIPECGQSRAISLYCFDKAAQKWDFDRTILSGFAAIDPTFVQHNGRWWLFCTDADHSPDTALYIWHAPDFTGPWMPHSANPVKVDVRSSRPAGTPFFHDGKLYRPTQDCSVSYGGSLRICRIDRLTPTEFLEVEEAHLRPISPYEDGLHTLAHSGQLTVIDGKRMRFAPALIARRLGHKLRKLIPGGKLQHI